MCFREKWTARRKKERNIQESCRKSKINQSYEETDVAEPNCHCKTYGGKKIKKDNMDKNI